MLLSLGTQIDLDSPSSTVGLIGVRFDRIFMWNNLFLYFIFSFFGFVCVENINVVVFRSGRRCRLWVMLVLGVARSETTLVYHAMHANQTCMIAMTAVVVDDVSGKENF